MELDMARYAAAFHPGDPNYDLATFESVESAHIPRNTLPSSNLYGTPFSRSSIYYQPGSSDWENVSTLQQSKAGGIRGGTFGYLPSHFNNNNQVRGERLGLDSSSMNFVKSGTPHRAAPSSRPVVKQRIEKNKTKNQREYARQTAAKYRMALDGMVSWSLYYFEFLKTLNRVL